MRKLSIALATLATIAIAAPSIASAEDFGVGVRVGGDRDHFRHRGEFRDRDDFRGARAEFRDRDDFRGGARAEFRDRDRGFHRDFDRDRDDRRIVIKRHHHDWD